MENDPTINQPHEEELPPEQVLQPRVDEDLSTQDDNELTWGIYWPD